MWQGDKNHQRLRPTATGPQTELPWERKEGWPEASESFAKELRWLEDKRKQLSHPVSSAPGLGGGPRTAGCSQSHRFDNTLKARVQRWSELDRDPSHFCETDKKIKKQIFSWCPSKKKSICAGFKVGWPRIDEIQNDEERRQYVNFSTKKTKPRSQRCAWQCPFNNPAV